MPHYGEGSTGILALLAIHFCSVQADRRGCGKFPELPTFELGAPRSAQRSVDLGLVREMGKVFDVLNVLPRLGKRRANSSSVA